MVRWARRLPPAFRGRAAAAQPAGRAAAGFEPTALVAVHPPSILFKDLLAGPACTVHEGGAHFGSFSLCLRGRVCSAFGGCSAGTFILSPSLFSSRPIRASSSSRAFLSYPCATTPVFFVCPDWEIPPFRERLQPPAAIESRCRSTRRAVAPSPGGRSLLAPSLSLLRASIFCYSL